MPIVEELLSFLSGESMKEEGVITEEVEVIPEERWRVLEEGIKKAELILDGCEMNEVFTTQECILYADCVYHIGRRYSNHQALVDRFKKALENGIVSKVLPSVMSVTDKDGIHLLTEFLQQWKNYKMMAKCLIQFFEFIDCQITRLKTGTPRLVDISFCSFHELVCKDLHRRLIYTTVLLISLGRDSLQIHEHLLPGLSFFFVEFGEHGYESYYCIFEAAMLKDAASYYSHLASEWYPRCSSTDYVLKVEQVLLEEKIRASKFLQQSSTEMLLQVVHSQMLEQYEDKLAQKQKTENTNSMLYKVWKLHLMR